MQTSIRQSLFISSIHFLLMITAASQSTFSLDWKRHTFLLPESIWSVESADWNNDGHRDLIAMGETKVFVLEAPRWEPRMIFDSKEPKMLYCVALDADHDGDLDIALGRYRQPWIEYRQNRSQGKQSAEPQGPDFSVGWLENTGGNGEAPLHIIDRELNGIHGLFAGDVNGDGTKDLISDSIIGPGFPNSIVWFALSSKTISRRLVTKNGADGRPHYLEFADINNDGKGDILLGDSQGGTFTWWEQQSSDQWLKHLIAREPGATNIRVADLNGDGKLDVIGSSGHGKGVFWFEASGWTRHAIDPDLATPHALAVGDFDQDGHVDIAAASFTAWLVRWYHNNGKGNFQPHDIDTGHQQQAYDMKTVDLDSDGRPDLILAGRESRNAVWFQNKK